MVLGPWYLMGMGVNWTLGLEWFSVHFNSRSYVTLYVWRVLHCVGVDQTLLFHHSQCSRKRNISKFSLLLLCIVPLDEKLTSFSMFVIICWVFGFCVCTLQGRCWLILRLHTMTWLNEQTPSRELSYWKRGVQFVDLCVMLFPVILEWISLNLASNKLMYFSCICWNL